MKSGLETGAADVIRKTVPCHFVSPAVGLRKVCGCRLSLRHQEYTKGGVTRDASTVRNVSWVLSESRRFRRRSPPPFVDSDESQGPAVAIPRRTALRFILKFSRQPSSALLALSPARSRGSGRSRGKVIGTRHNRGAFQTS